MDTCYHCGKPAIIIDPEGRRECYKCWCGRLGIAPAGTEPDWDYGSERDRICARLWVVVELARKGAITDTERAEARADIERLRKLLPAGPPPS